MIKLPEKHLYGVRKILRVKSVSQNSHREPTGHDEYNRPIGWVNITRYSLRLEGGGSISGKVEDRILNIHRGDSIEVYQYGTKYTYAKNMITGLVLINDPVINPEWEKYVREKEIAKRKRWNSLSLIGRCKDNAVNIVIITGAGLFAGFYFSSLIPIYKC